jgi:hypothetical protein
MLKNPTEPPKVAEAGPDKDRRPSKFRGAMGFPTLVAPIALPSFVFFSTTVLWSVFLTLSLIRKWINAIQR